MAMNEQWESLPPMSTERWHCAAAAADGRLFVFGGYNGSSNYLSSAAAYDPRTDTWEDIVSMSKKRGWCKISELVDVVEDVHQLKLFYTLVNSCHRLGYVDDSDRAGYLRSALETVSGSTTCDDSVSLYKLALKKAREDGIIDDYTMNVWDRRAEVAHTSNAPFVKDLWENIRANTERIRSLEGRVDGLESRVEGLEGRVDRVESCCRDLHASLVKLQKGLRRQKKVEAAVGIMGAVLNAVSFGVAGSVASGAMGLAVNSIVDFGDLGHIQAVVEALGDVTVEEALKTGLDLIEDKASNKLYSAAKEGSTILQGRVHAELIAAANDGNPLVAIALTAQVVGGGHGTGQGPGRLPETGRDHQDPQAPPAAPPSRNAKQRIQRLEEELALEDVPTVMMQRVGNIELNFFGETQEGRLLDRIAKLEDELGL